MFLLNPFEMVSFQGTCFLFWVGGNKNYLLHQSEKSCISKSYDHMYILKNERTYLEHGVSSLGPFQPTSKNFTITLGRLSPKYFKRAMKKTLVV